MWYLLKYGSPIHGIQISIINLRHGAIEHLVVILAHVFRPNFFDLLGALCHTNFHAIFEEIQMADDEGRAVAFGEGEHELVAHGVHEHRSA